MPLLLGAIVEEDGPHEHASGRRYFNAALLSSPEGAELGRYDKRALVPIGERPIGPGILARLGPRIPLESGDRSAVLSLGPHRMSVSICYEDMLPAAFRSTVDRRADLLVNLTSDGWFDGSDGPAFHLALARWRAVEHRRYLLRGTTTGISAVVSPTGQIEWVLPEGAKMSGAVTIHWVQGLTIYELFGNSPFYALPVLLLLELLGLSPVGRRVGGHS